MVQDDTLWEEKRLGTSPLCTATFHAELGGSETSNLPGLGHSKSRSVMAELHTLYKPPENKTDNFCKIRSAVGLSLALPRGLQVSGAHRL